MCIEQIPISNYFINNGNHWLNIKMMMYEEIKLQILVNTLFYMYICYVLMYTHSYSIRYY